MKKLGLSVLLLLVAACSHKATPTPKASIALQLTPQQIQANMQEAGTPGQPHEILKKLAGNWNAEVKMWMDPSGKPEVSKGKAKNELIFNGRFLQMSYKGTFMGQPFEGQGVTGYDNVAKKYFSTWIDTMSTSMMHAEGYGDATGNSLTFAANFVCPMTRESINAEDVYTLVDKNHFRYEMYQVKDGTKFKSLEINYSRSK